MGKNNKINKEKEQVPMEVVSIENNEEPKLFEESSNNEATKSISLDDLDKSKHKFMPIFDRKEKVIEQRTTKRKE